MDAKTFVDNLITFHQNEREAEAKQREQEYQERTAVMIERIRPHVPEELHPYLTSDGDGITLEDIPECGPISVIVSNGIVYYTAQPCYDGDNGPYYDSTEGWGTSDLPQVLHQARQQYQKFQALKAQPHIQQEPVRPDYLRAAKNAVTADQYQAAIANALIAIAQQLSRGE